MRNIGPLLRSRGAYSPLWEQLLILISTEYHEMGQNSCMDQIYQIDESKKAQFIAYIQEARCGVIATADREHGPESAFINLAVTSELAILFETLITSRKYRNLQRDPRASLVIGGHGQTTLQLEGLVDEPTETLRDEVMSTYYEACSQNLSHSNWPGVTYMRFRPRWVRYSDYGLPWKVEEYFLSR